MTSTDGVGGTACSIASGGTTAAGGSQTIAGGRVTGGTLSSLPIQSTTELIGLGGTGTVGGRWAIGGSDVTATSSTTGGLGSTGGVLATSATTASPLRIVQQRTEYRVNPIGLDVALPRMQWQLESALENEWQTAYRVRVAGSEAALVDGEADLWDSGKVHSGESTQIVYGGSPLKAGRVAYWNVEVWNKSDVPSGPSNTATWEMGPDPTAGEWQAQWITAPPATLSTPGLHWIGFPEAGPPDSSAVRRRLFRRMFTVSADPIQRASLIVTGSRTYRAFVNGVTAAVGTEWQNAQSVEITPLLVHGNNAVAVDASGLDSDAGILAQLRLETSSGEATLISTDESWRTSQQPPADGWQLASYDDRDDFTPARVIAPYGQGVWGTVTIGTGGGGPARYLRRAFAVDKPVKRARLHATALGLYEPSLNGKRVGAQHFAPGWTDYSKRLQLQSYDVTTQLLQGQNVLGLVLGDGWFQGRVASFSRGQYGPGPIRALCQLELELSDGSRQVVATDENWEASSGPIIASDLIDGEEYDARRELLNWNAPGSTATGFVKAEVIAAAQVPTLVAQPDDGITAAEELAPLGVTEREPGVFVYDLGQNMSGWVRLSVIGTRGATLTLRFAEVLNPDGSLYTANLRSALASERYTLRGGTREIYEPHFTSHGFRYVELSGEVSLLTAPPDITTITGIVAHAATPSTLTFSTSDEVLNKLQRNIVWSQKGNFTAVPTDCPQRDERLGWTGDAQIFAPTAAMNMNVAAFFTKWTRDVDDAQSAAGAFPDIAPSPPALRGAGTPGWGDAGVIVPFTVYLSYGDKRILQEHYPAMKRWIQYIASANPNQLWQRSRGSDYGDWLSIDADTDKEVIATAFYAHSADLVARTAKILEKSEDQSMYEQLFSSIAAAFRTAYVTDDGHVKSDTQTAYALALRFNLLTPTQRIAVASRLNADLESRSGYLSTGFLGVAHLLPALSGAGSSNTAYRLLSNEGFPSWRYEINRGATTIWERWNGIEPNGAWYDPAMNSFNHYSFGAVGEWIYNTILGLELDEDVPGWKSFRVRPQPGAGLTSARGSFLSPYGVIGVDWTLLNGLFTLKVAVPVNTRAEVILPFRADAAPDAGPAVDAVADGHVVGSGTHVFTVRTP